MLSCSSHYVPSCNGILVQCIIGQNCAAVSAATPSHRPALIHSTDAPEAGDRLLALAYPHQQVRETKTLLICTMYLSEGILWIKFSPSHPPLFDSEGQSRTHPPNTPTLRLSNVPYPAPRYGRSAMGKILSTARASLFQIMIAAG